MSIPTSDLPGPVLSALRHIETELPTIDPVDDPLRRALDEDVIQVVQSRLRDDPVAAALLTSPKILRYCLDRAVQTVSPPWVGAVPDARAAGRLREPLQDVPESDVPDASAPADAPQSDAPEPDGPERDAQAGQKAGTAKGRRGKRAKP